MDDEAAKGALRLYFDEGHTALEWKLDGLGEYDLRRPMTPTGTNLLGIAKHIAWVDLEYLGTVFGREHGVPKPDDEVNVDMYATEDETSAAILELFERGRAHALATIDELDLDAVGRVPWWGPGGTEVTLHRVLVHVTTDLYRHLGHADIARETIDGAVGFRPAAPNIPEVDADYWTGYDERLEQIARAADQG